MIKSFLKDKSGNFGMMGSFIVLALMGGVGLAVDYNAMTTKQVQLQSAVDAAVLAASSSGETNQTRLQTIAKDSIATTMLTEQGLDVDFIWVDDVMTINAQIQYKPLLMGIFGFGAQGISASTTAPRSFDNPLDVALVLDVTGSMNQDNKLTNMKKVLTDFLTDLDQADVNLRVSIVPFSQYVNVGKNNDTASWIDMDALSDPAISSAWDGCVGSRPGNNALRPLVENGKRIPVVAPGYDEDVADTTISYFCPADAVTPLTDMISAQITKINNIAASGSTYTPAGLIWGWRTLVPEAPLGVAATGETPRKVLILLSDGSNTRSKKGQNSTFHTETNNNNNNRAQDRADKQTERICTNMKDEGVDVFTVIFGLTENNEGAEDTRDLLEDCANSPASYFDASNAQGLRESFKDIRSSLASPRLLN